MLYYTFYRFRNCRTRFLLAVLLQGRLLCRGAASVFSLIRQEFLLAKSAPANCVLSLRTLTPNLFIISKLTDLLPKNWSIQNGRYLAKSPLNEVLPDEEVEIHRTASPRVRRTAECTMNYWFCSENSIRRGRHGGEGYTLACDLRVNSGRRSPPRFAVLCYWQLSYFCGIGSVVREAA